MSTRQEQEPRKPPRRLRVYVVPNVADVDPKRSRCIRGSGLIALRCQRKFDPAVTQARACGRRPRVRDLLST